MGFDDWDISEKCCVFVWCDWIFWKGKNIIQLSYQSYMVLKISDYKFVSLVFDIGVRVVNDEFYWKILEEIVCFLDKMENVNIFFVFLFK